MKLTILLAAIGFMFGLKMVNAQTVETDCEHLSDLHSAGSHVLSVEHLVAGPMQMKHAYTRSVPMQLPPHCVVRMRTPTSADSAVIVEMWLPDPDAWNGKLLGTGNGGYSSELSYFDMANGLKKGFAVAGSDTGHQGGDLSFGTDHPERIRDWAYRSTHVLAEDAKAVITAFYRRSPKHAYFQGCSTGGQQALSEAQRYPQDFDGIVAGDAGNDRILLNADFVESWLVTHPAHGDAFPASKLKFLSRAVIAACDAKDGITDGVIDDPRRCSFDPGSLSCGAGDHTSECLTEPEVVMVRRLYEGSVRDNKGKPLYPGWPRGSEAGWGNYLIAPTEPVRLEFWSSWIYGSSFNLSVFEAPSAIAAARNKLGFVEAVSPDLRPFRNDGGKLILYHGWADPVVPPQDSINYYEKVREVLGSSTEETARLFMVPGMGHCGGGPGAAEFDALNALDRWVTGVAVPDSILAIHTVDGKPTFERPLCPTPEVAQWDGRSDVSKASSFHCAKDR